MSIERRAKPSAIVAGGGIGGLAAALGLANEGCAVTVLEERLGVGLLLNRPPPTGQPRSTSSIGNRPFTIPFRRRRRCRSSSKRYAHRWPFLSRTISPWSSVTPSTKYSCSGSPPILARGRTAMGSAADLTSPLQGRAPRAFGFSL
jgi:hypothetical protein